MCRLQLVGLLGVPKLDRKDHISASTLLRRNAVRLVEEKVLDCSEEKSAEPTAALVGLSHVILFEQPNEEVLGQVTGLVRFVPLSADERIQRIPVTLAQTCQSLFRLIVGAPSASDYKTPRGGR